MLSIYRGDAKTFNLTFTNTDGTPFVLSGYSLLFNAGPSYDAEPVITGYQTGYVSAVSGMMSLTLTSGDTNVCPFDYVAQFYLIDSDGNQSTYETDGIRILPSFHPR